MHRLVMYVDQPAVVKEFQKLAWTSKFFSKIVLDVQIKKNNFWTSKKVFVTWMTSGKLSRRSRCQGISTICLDVQIHFKHCFGRQKTIIWELRSNLNWKNSKSDLKKSDLKKSDLKIGIRWNPLESIGFRWKPWESVKKSVGTHWNPLESDVFQDPTF